MKKRIALIFAICLMVLAAGCGSREEKAKEVPAAEAASQLLETVTFKDSLISVPDDMVENYYNLENTKATEKAVYVSGSGATAEEIAVFQAADADDAKALKDVLSTRVEDLKFTFENYQPAEMEKLGNPVIVTKGNAVILVVCDDAEQAEKAIDSIYNA